MKLSSRWSVTALVAVGALGCSDPVAPPAQGAFSAQVSAASPAPVRKSCPVPSIYFEVPDVPPATTAGDDERLDYNTYLHSAIDGASGAQVSCSVKGQGASFEGRISADGKTLDISSGTLDATLKGTARISIGNSAKISGSLSSPAADCVINASNVGGTRYEVAPGHIYASFDCQAVERQPSDSCAARGTFVLENCNQ